MRIAEPSARGELHGVAHQVDDHLSQSPRVGAHDTRQVGIDAYDQFKVLCVGGGGHQGTEILERLDRVIRGVIPPGTPANPGPLPEALRVLGSDSIRSEKVTSAELGYRVLLGPTLALDTTAFLARYSELRSPSISPPAMVMLPVPHVLIESTLGNGAEATLRGAELVVDYKPTANLRLVASLALLSLDSPSAAPGSGTAPADFDFRKYIWPLRANCDVSDRVSIDGMLRGAARSEATGASSYTEFDLRLAYRWSKAVELSLVGRNLLHAQRLEYRDDLLQSNPVQVPRSMFAFVRMRF